MAMKKLTPDIVAKAVGGRYVGPESARHALIKSVVRDDREAAEGSLFVCIRGERADGHDFAARAFASGAVCCLCQRTPPGAEDKPHILVDSTLDALKALGEYYRSLFNIPVVGVTGSVGKTTAKEMIAAVLSRRFNVLKTQGNLNNEIGVPLTLLSIQEEHEAAVVEMGISDFGEMHRIAKMVRPDISVITAIGYSHLENLGSLEGVLRAKAEVFEYMTPQGLAVLNGDDALLSQYDPGIPVVTFGTEESCDLRAESVRQRMDGAEPVVDFTVAHGEKRFDARVRAFGAHLVYGALAAAAAGIALGVPDEEIARGLMDFKPIGSRARVVGTGYITLIDDSYNANPSSMRAALSSLATLEGRKVALLGDMFELGEESDTLHREIGEFAAKCGIDCLICCGQKAEFIFKGLISTGSEIEAWHFPLKAALLSALPRLIRPGDNVLVKASHGMHFEELAQALEALR
jgi:UDP-N-acetylmuramoyl-tripeptide--D-alanyl-D-alanine ligase